MLKNKKELKNKKAQISLEMLIVIGVFIIIAIVFATIYINRMSANKTSDNDTSDLIDNINVNNYEIVHETTSTFCGNGACEPTLGETSITCPVDCSP